MGYDEQLVSDTDRLGVVRTRLAEMRNSLKEMRHTSLCSTFVDRAPEEECDCSKHAVVAWIGYVEDACGVTDTDTKDET